MWWSLLLTLAIQLLKWLLSEDSPLNRKDEAKLREFFEVADKAKVRARARGMKL